MNSLRERDYPKSWPAVVGYFLAHPRTWCIVLAVAFSWQCFGLREWAHRHFPALEATASAHSHLENP